MRYAYVKPNNVVREVKRVLERRARPAQGGPDAYVAHFLDIAGNDPVLLLSNHFYPVERDERYARENIVARSIYWYSRRLKRLGTIARRPLGTALTRIVGATKIFLSLKRFAPERVLCWAYSLPLWATYAAAVVTGARFVYSSHGYLIDANRAWYQRISGAVDRWIIRRASAVIVHGPYLKQCMRDIGVPPERIYEFNWSFRHFDVATDESDRVGGDAAPRTSVLFIGRVETSKGVFELLEALTDRLRQDPALELVYAGDGTELESLRRAVHEKGLDRQVRLLGRVGHDLLPDIIRRSRCVVTPTQGWYPEGRCMAALEGLVMGRPVVAPDFGPFPYVVTHGADGLLFQPDSIEDLRTKLSALIDDDALHARLSAGARAASRLIRSSDVDFGHAARAAFGMSPGRSANSAGEPGAPRLPDPCARGVVRVEEEAGAPDSASGG